MSRVCVALFALAGLAVASCGGRTTLLDFSAGAQPKRDSGVDASTDAALDAPPDALPDAYVQPGCTPVNDDCGSIEICGNGLDDNCNGQVDEGCRCTPGQVEKCFPGPPGRRGVGVCADGTATCLASGTWGACQGAIVPGQSVCNGADDSCTGCSAQGDCAMSCPDEGDARVPDGEPLKSYLLRGSEFYPGHARSWRWQIDGGPCDRFSSGPPSFVLSGASSENATFLPRLSGDYTVTLTVVTERGTRLSCKWAVHVYGPGLRVEMCYPESETEDLDLFVKQPGHHTPWYPPNVTAYFPSIDQCGWHNCEATVRGRDPNTGEPLQRAIWGYVSGPLSECAGGPEGGAWRALGFCPNPRLDIDNNLFDAKGVPENINLDAPHDGETFRIMVQNFTGKLAHPLVNVYCSGLRVATYGQAPDALSSFQGTSGKDGIGAMWRVADVTVHTGDAGGITCDATLLHHPGASSGYDVTYDDPRY
jgi:hypothetical protein